MSNFVSYARNNGFTPIQVPDTSERDLRQQQRELTNDEEHSSLVRITDREFKPN